MPLPSGVLAEPRSTLETIDEKLAELDELAAELRERIASAPEREAQARAEAIRQQPGHRPGGARSPVQKIIETREKDERLLASAELDIVGYTQVRQEELEKQASAMLAELNGRAEALRTRERETLREASEAFVAFHEKFLAWARGVKEREEGLAHDARVALADSAPDWLAGDGRPVLDPVPSDFMAFFAYMLEAGFDPFQRNYRLTNEGHAPLDYGNELVRLVPDMRARKTVIDVHPERSISSARWWRGVFWSGQAAASPGAGWGAEGRRFSSPFVDRRDRPVIP
jgi:hypothetical protein